jgi:putative nucleotidyltransferase with HDIG domain
MRQTTPQPSRTGSWTRPGTVDRPLRRPHPLPRGLDTDTANHCRRVAWYAAGFAERLGMPEEEVEVVRLGALMHDVGKTAVPVALLNKTESLSTVELTRLRTHCAAGERMTATMGLPKGVQEIVRHHHERWDGAGYPDGLAGEDIPFKARIVCIVDAFDAIITPRSYQAARSTRQALRILENESARLFDPELLDAFFLLMNPGKRLGLGPVAA